MSRAFVCLVAVLYPGVGATRLAARPQAPPVSTGERHAAAAVASGTAVSAAASSTRRPDAGCRAFRCARIPNIAGPPPTPYPWVAIDRRRRPLRDQGPPGRHLRHRRDQAELRARARAGAERGRRPRQADDDRRRPGARQDRPAPDARRRRHRTRSSTSSAIR